MICGSLEFVSWFDSTLWSDIKVEDVNSRSVDRTLDIEEKDELVVSDDDRSKLERRFTYISLQPKQIHSTLHISHQRMFQLLVELVMVPIHNYPSEIVPSDPEIPYLFFSRFRSLKDL